MSHRYEFVMGMLRALLSTFGRIEVEGVENIPEQGAFVLATNHISRLDTPLLGVTCSRRVYALVAIKYKSYPVFRWILDSTDPVWVRRTDFDREALLHSLAVLKRGDVLGLAPEGTRSSSATLQDGKSGVVFLAARAKAPIIPVAVTGTDQMMERFRRLQRVPLHVKYGKPFRLPQEGRLTSDELAVATELVMLRIAQLLPPAYRGVYATAVAEAESDGVGTRVGSYEVQRTSG